MSWPSFVSVLNTQIHAQTDKILILGHGHRPNFWVIKAKVITEVTLRATNYIASKLIQEKVINILINVKIVIWIECFPR